MSGVGGEAYPARALLIRIPRLAVGLRGEECDLVLELTPSGVQQAGRMDTEQDEVVAACGQFTVEVHGCVLAGEVVHGVARVLQGLTSGAYELRVGHGEAELVDDDGGLRLRLRRTAIAGRQAAQQ